MSAPAVKVTGAERLHKELVRAESDLDDMTEVNRRAARIVMVTAAPRAPRRSGRLAASVRPVAQPHLAGVQAGGHGVPYAGVIHFGWPARNITAQPWLAEAGEASEPQVIQEYENELDRILDNVAGGP